MDIDALLSNSSSNSSSDSENTSDSSSSDDWSDILGPDWRCQAETAMDVDSDTDSMSDSDTSSEDMPELRSVGFGSDSDSESDLHSISWDGRLSDVDFSGVDGDDEESISDNDVEHCPPLLRCWIQQEIDTMHEPL
jgi:hypothetical protein